MKTAVITGASRGIGMATAKKFLAEGYKVIGTSRTGEINLEHSNLTKIALELSSSESIEKATQQIGNVAESIDVLVNNAAVALDTWDTGVNLEKVRKTFEINLFGLIDLTEKLVSLMSRGGHIININSRYGSFSMPIDDDSSIGYRMAKAALNMYTRFLAERLKKQEVIVSSLDPGWVKTDMGNSGASEEFGAPDREPEEPANEIFDIVQNVRETGKFWYKGKEREW